MAYQRSDSIFYYHCMHLYFFLSPLSSISSSTVMVSLFYCRLGFTFLRYFISLSIDIIFLCIISHLLGTSALVSCRYCRCRLAHIYRPIEIHPLMKNCPFQSRERWIKFNLSIVIIIQMIICFIKNWIEMKILIGILRFLWFIRWNLKSIAKALYQYSIFLGYLPDLQHF